MIFGDIILIPFPFSELTRNKIRPAVVITETKDKYKDLVVSAISSVVPEKLSEREFIVYATKTNKLRIDSIVKTDRIVTIKRNDLIAKLGRLNDKEKQQFKSVLISMIG